MYTAKEGENKHGKKAGKQHRHHNKKSNQISKTVGSTHFFSPPYSQVPEWCRSQNRDLSQIAL